MAPVGVAQGSVAEAKRGAGTVKIGVEVDEVSMQQVHFVHHTAQVSPVVFSTFSLHEEQLWL
jgi:hypothetical protein